MISNGLIKQMAAPVKRYRAHFSTFFKTLKRLMESKEAEGKKAR